MKDSRRAAEKLMAMAFGLMIVSFVGGFLLMMDPTLAGTTFGVGFFFNIAIVWLLGVALGWMRRWGMVAVSAAFATLIIQLGVNLPLLASSVPLSQGTQSVVIFETYVVILGIFGISVLLCTGALIGWIARVFSKRCGLCTRVAGRFTLNSVPDRNRRLRHPMAFPS